MWITRQWRLLSILALATLGLVACAEGSEHPDDAPAPEIQIVDGGALSWNLEPGESDEATFTIENPGQRTLEFTIEFESDWLDISPFFGDVDAEGALEITAEATCPDEEGEQDTTLQIEHNDPSSAPVGLSAVLVCEEEENGENNGENNGEEDEEGELEVVVNGLPGGLDAAIDVQGAEDFSASVTETTILEEVPAGTVTLSANAVGTDEVYEPDPAQTTVEVEDDERAEVVITYELVPDEPEEPADLDIQVSGLPGGASPSIEVDGPDGAETYDEAMFLEDITPGAYTVAFHTIEFDGTSYAVDDSPFDVDVERGEATVVAGEYEALPADIGILSFDVDVIGDVSFSLSVDGPDNFSESVSGTTSFNDIEPGTYTIAIDEVSEDDYGNEGYVIIEPSTTVDVSSGSTTNVSVTAGEATVVAAASGDGPGSLPAILDGSLNAGSVVSFDASLDVVDVSGGELIIDSTITIVGDDDASVVLEADGDRLFRVTDGGFFALEGLTLQGGDTSGSGGAINIESGGAAIVERTIFEDNSADDHGGAIYVEDGADLLVEEAIFRDNSAGENGGAIATTMSYGSSAGIDIEASLFHANNSGADGGALYLSNDSHVFESTFYENIATERGGAIRVWADETVILGCTIVENLADDGGGIQYYGDFDTSLVLGRSVVAENFADTGPDIARTLNDRDVDSEGYNLVGVGADGLQDEENGDRVGSASDPLSHELGAFTDNGGFSQTRAPFIQSLARESVPAAACDELRRGELPVRDQRRERRPSGAFCNIGAHEHGGALETFENVDPAISATSYEDGTFTGDDGVEWTYEEARRSGSQSGTIEDTSLILRDSPDGSIKSEQLSGGISSLSMQLAHAFTGGGNRQVEVLVNGNVVGASEPFDDSDVDGIGGGGTIRRFAVEDIDVDGDFDIEIRSIGSGQILVDNVTWR